jgi:hypothetical protein
MLQVTIEKISATNGKKTIIGRMLLWNDGSGTENKATYKGIVRRRGQEEFSQKELQSHELDPDRMTRRFEVRDYPRNAYNVWRLVTRALRSAFHEER